MQVPFGIQDWARLPRQWLRRRARCNQEMILLLTMWFDQPAEQWADALPVGNGRLGAMVFGEVKSERIALNEDTLWSGAPRNWNNPDAKTALPVVRKLVLEDKNYGEADKECHKMQGPFNDAYEPLGDLLIEFDGGEEAHSYKRSLDLDSAIARVEYQAGASTYTREIFVSAPDQVSRCEANCQQTAFAELHAQVIKPDAIHFQVCRRDDSSEREGAE